MPAVPTPADPPWVAAIPWARLRAVAALRLAPGVQAAATEDRVWLSGPAEPGTLRLLRGIADLVLYQRRADGNLYAWSARGHAAALPDAAAPAVAWEPLAGFLTVQAPDCLAAPAGASDVPLILVRSAGEVAAAAVLTPLTVLLRWAETASQLRLDPLTHAIRDDGHVLVVGNPLPPVSGEWFSLTDGVAVPCGWRTEPDLPPAVLRQWLRLPPDGLALLHADGTVSRIPGESLIPVTRAGLRAAGSRLPGGM